MTNKILNKSPINIINHNDVRNKDLKCYFDNLGSKNKNINMVDLHSKLLENSNDFSQYRFKNINQEKL